ncbi:hypothetical protein BDR07DRAFT_1409401 [Suillus spraguei]|nr:hypothetical protein BDR07DRAFT_1409401 [Suillus spraguei]
MLNLAGDGHAISLFSKIISSFLPIVTVLQLCVQAIPNFAYENLKVDSLINATETMWLSLVAEDFMMPVPKLMLRPHPCRTR